MLRVFVLFLVFCSCGSGRGEAERQQRVGAQLSFPAPAPHILVQAKINGLDATLIFDTGATELFLQKSFAERAGVRIVGEQEVRSWFFEEQAIIRTVEIGIVDSMQAFGRNRSNVRATIADFISHEQADGFIGLEAIEDLVLIISLAERMMYVE